MSYVVGGIRCLAQVSEREIQELGDVLVDCVEGGASVSFMLPFSRDRAASFWRNVADAVHRGERALLVSEDERGISGTVQLNFALPENQPHRADVAKMLVHRRARRRGVGAALMRAAEMVAMERGRSLLVLDTVTDSDAARLYERLGWVRVGEIPGYALLPGGGQVGTTVYYRELGAGADAPTASALSLSSGRK
ncbi:MAG TPA: GNAT family N-acetyltransferase [Polyangiaceae bacterium]|nr:GNAT family N-acetyltransferase [Polyangiaceae bacterium]